MPLQKLGTGVLVLSGTNTYNGGTDIAAGTVSISSDGNLGAASTAVTLDSGTLQTTAPVINNRPFAITANNGTIDTGGVADIFTGAFTGAGTLVVNSSTAGGSLTLTSANTFAGGVNVSSGATVKIANSTALGFGSLSTKAVGTTVAAGGQLDLNGTTGVNEVITLNGSGPDGHGALTNSNASSAAVLSNGIATATIPNPGTAYTAAPSVTASAPANGTTAAANATLGLPTNYFTLVHHSGYDTFNTSTAAPQVIITGGGGTGAMAVATLNSSGGVASVTVVNPGSGYTSQPNINFSSATLVTTGSSGDGINSYFNGSGASFVVSGIQLTNPGSGYTTTPSFTLGSGNAVVTPVVSSIVLGSSSTIGGVGDIILTGPVTGGFDLTKVDSGALTLSASNSYTGGTNVSAGKLIVANSTGSGTGTGPVLVGPNATLGGNGIVAGLVTVNGTIAPGIVNNSSSNTLTIGTGSVLAGTTVLDLMAAPVSPLTTGTSDEIVFGDGTNSGIANFSGGTLSVVNTGGFTPAVGESFDLFLFNSSIGTFANSLPAPGPGLSWDTSRLYTSGILTIATGSSTTGTSGIWISTQSGNWETASNWQGGIVPSGASQTATFADSVGTGAATVTLTANETVGILAFTGNLGGSYTLASNATGSTGVTLDNGSLAAAITVNAGSQFITAPIALANGVNITTTPAGSLTIGGAVSGNGTFNTTTGSTVMVAPAGTIGVPLLVKGSLIFGQSSSGSSVLVRTIPSLTINNGSVTLSTAGNVPARQLLSTGGLSLSGSTGHWTGKLDLTNNDLDVQHGSLSDISNQVAEGLTNSSAGIVSSAATANPSHLTTLAVIQNSLDQNGGSALKATFDGVAVANTDVLVKYTYYGDTDLSGSVDGSDYSRIDAGFLAGATGWFNGDFNYDGVVNGSDYTLIDNAFNTQSAAISDGIAAPQAIETSQIAGVTSAVPEPTAIALLGISALGLPCRRKRHN